MNINYEEKIKELETQKVEIKNKRHAIEQLMKECEEKIKPLKERIREIKKECDYDSKEKERSKCFDEASVIISKITAIKLIHVCSLICDLTDEKLFKNQREIYKWLNDNFNIKIESWEFHNFQNFYKEVFDDDFDIDLDYDFYENNCKYYKIKYTWYFRGERDDFMCIYIPKEIIDDIDAFVQSFNEKINEMKTERDKQKMIEEENRKNARYQTYLQLKKEFDNQEAADEN